MGCKHSSYSRHIHARCQTCGYATDFGDEYEEDLDVGSMLGLDDHICPDHEDDMCVKKITWRCDDCNEDIG